MRKPEKPENSECFRTSEGGSDVPLRIHTGFHRMTLAEEKREHQAAWCSVQASRERQAVPERVGRWEIADQRSRKNPGCTAISPDSLEHLSDV